MSSKYVPPRMRNQPQQESDPIPPPPPKDEFPPLPTATTTTTSTTAWTGKKKFSELAQEWNVTAKEEKLRREIEEAARTHEQQVKYSDVAIPKFHNVGRFIEPEDDDDGYISSESDKKEDSDGWIEVRKKARKEKDLTEILNRPPTPEQEETTKWDQATEEEEDSYWKRD